MCVRYKWGRKKKKHEQPLQLQQLGECLKTIIFWGEEDLLELKLSGHLETLNI